MVSGVIGGDLVRRHWAVPEHMYAGGDSVCAHCATRTGGPLSHTLTSLTAEGGGSADQSRWWADYGIDESQTDRDEC